ncbi:ATP-binding cassette domain-containing protein [Alloscardovia theropitheci]|uniref:ATP-binding cassette domain-containing protein n=1 Tax=Alloscardovia theropitheci TaxID=2496842 RepID=A0A4R0QU35_9BIFI|nr:ATP-binding cassette domain-containing protein [Alloscardovia theropitheci]
MLLAREILGYRITQTERNNAFELLELVELSHVVNMPVSQLSGGEQQRVAIARAIARETTVLLADEPTGALDESNTIKIAELLHKIAYSKDVLVIACTHDDRCAQCADATFAIQDYNL